HHLHGARQGPISKLLLKQVLHNLQNFLHILRNAETDEVVRGVSIVDLYIANLAGVAIFVLLVFALLRHTSISMQFRKTLSHTLYHFILGQIAINGNYITNSSGLFGIIDIIFEEAPNRVSGCSFNTRSLLITIAINFMIFFSILFSIFFQRISYTWITLLKIANCQALGKVALCPLDFHGF